MKRDGNNDAEFLLIFNHKLWLEQLIIAFRAAGFLFPFVYSPRNGLVADLLSAIDSHHSVTSNSLVETEKLGLGTSPLTRYAT
jgi:hypothetical protein